jgi:hypothetical protein
MPHENSPEAVNQPGPQARPLRAAAVVIYGTLVLLAIATPQGLVNWLRDMKSGEIQETLLRGAEAVQTMSQRTGVAVPYIRARALFLAWAGKEDD